MSEQISISEGQSSENQLTCLRNELPDLADKHPLETIIRVKDENYRTYILLEDVDGNKYWRPYGGEKIEEVRAFHKWELEAQKKFKDEKRSNEEIDFLRNILMSVWMVSKFFELDEDMVNEFMGETITRISMKWYCKDKNIEEDSLNIDEHEEGLKVYFHLASFYVTSFFATMTELAGGLDPNVQN